MWSQSTLRLLSALLLDAFREPFALWPFVLRGYWRCGAARWLASFRHAMRDVAQESPRAVLMIAGERNPLPAIRNLIHVPGAHACHFSFADVTAREVQEFAARPSPPPAPR